MPNSGNWVLGPEALDYRTRPGLEGTLLQSWPLSTYDQGNIIVSPHSERSNLVNVLEYLGEPNVPNDVKRRRRSNMSVMKRMGAPIVIKHMYNDQDVQNGDAIRSPNFDPEYGQTRNRDPLSHGVGFVGALDGQMIQSADEWYDTAGSGGVVRSATSPGDTWVQAPRFRGYGPGFLTYVIMPDVSEDVFKMNEGGVLIRTQQAQVQMGWFPEANDNDLLITCRVDRAYNVVETYERYELKTTNAISVRGLDRKGRREYSEDFGNRHVLAQEYEMSLTPGHHEIYSVEYDR